MATERPVWLDACYVQTILRNAEKDESIDVSGITVTPATVKGDNFSSDVHRVAVKYSRIQDGHAIQEEKSLIVKVALKKHPRKEFVETVGHYRTESKMLSITLPKMNKILENVFSTPLAARCFYVQNEKPTHVVVDDLVAQGFRMAERYTGMDLDHSLLVLRYLAKFHAASIALKEKDPNSLAMYNKGLFHVDHFPVLGPFFNSLAKCLADEAAKWPELSPRIKEKLQELYKVTYQMACKATVFREDDFNVLNHGDIWKNNIMFRYDERQKPIDLIFMDFQLSQYASPAVDILHFLSRNPTDLVRFQHRELLLREYHTLLISTMAKLECKTEGLSFEELRETLKLRAFIEVFYSMICLPVSALDKDEAKEFTEVRNGDEVYDNSAYRGKAYRKIMSRLLPLYDSMGLLDV